jgi:hypothetical protein
MDVCRGRPLFTATVYFTMAMSITAGCGSSDDDQVTSGATGGAPWSAGGSSSGGAELLGGTGFGEGGLSNEPWNPCKAVPFLRPPCDAEVDLVAVSFGPTDVVLMPRLATLPSAPVSFVLLPLHTSEAGQGGAAGAGNMPNLALSAQWLGPAGSALGLPDGSFVVLSSEAEFKLEVNPFNQAGYFENLAPRTAANQPINDLGPYLAQLAAIADGEVVDRRRIVIQIVLEP